MDLHRALNGYLELVAITLLLYDHFLTFTAEVNAIWTRPLSIPSLWFFINRYIPFFGNSAVSIVSFANMTEVRRLLNAAASRAVDEQHALWHIHYSLHTAHDAHLRTVRPLAPHPFIDISRRPCVISRGMHVAVAWEAQAGFDLLIFGLTITKSTIERRQRPGINSWFRLETGLIDLIYRDGAIYFAFMVLANLSNIFTFYFAPDGLRGVLSTFASWYVPPLRHLTLNYTPTHRTHSVSVTMMSHLMLNLHKAASFTHTLHHTSDSSGPSIAFTTHGIDPPAEQTGLDGSSSLSRRTPQPTRVLSSQGATGRSSLSSSTASSLFTDQAGNASGSGSSGGASAGRKKGRALRSELEEIELSDMH
ncbi:hypothetical protein EW146_g7276 [Bondarzewia mesenterica]|uniref:DUF6533 domain-containing protein n=1 Tax=Bondarzewia mesenterica TaxID=1095465 RepID=A0A4S4LLT5_9AGAM|nr:hypothetical protein EW146_g7276 [Bondarzewia mesenterica]